MAEAWFYHLTQSPLEVTLEQLLHKSLGAGWRVLVRGTDPARLAWLDDRLWLGGREEFLPHGLAGGRHDARQPVLLSGGSGNPNGADCLILVDGAAAAPEELAGFRRCCLIFDGNDPAAVEAARGQWRSVTGAAIAAQYWAETDGRWAMRSKTG